MEKKRNAPGKHYREGISIIQMSQMFPDEEAARVWFETIRWPDAEPGNPSEDRPCPRCGSCSTHPTRSGRPMPYRCRDCHRYFSVLTGTTLERTHIPLQKWAYGMYFWMTSLKGISSMRLARELNITQKSAWFMAHRLREAFAGRGWPFSGPVEVDETYIGGKRKNMSKAKRKEMRGSGTVGKTAVVGMKDRSTNEVRARVVEDTRGETLRGFALSNTEPYTKIYTDEARVYKKLPNQESVRHASFEYVRGDVHTNGVESFWSMLKRGYVGVFHKMSPKHLQRYVDEFVGRHNFREWDTADQMRVLVMAMIGRRLMYKDLIADNGLDSGARST